MRDRGWLARRVPGPVWRIALGVAMGPGLVLCVVVFRWFLLEPFRVPSGSMIPTTRVGDHVLALKYAYGIRLPLIGGYLVRWADPARGDVVFFQYPRDPSIIYVKRVVGLPGDRVAFRDNQVILNGEPVPREPGAPGSWTDGSCREGPVASFTERLGDHRFVTFHNVGLGGGLSDKDEVVVPPGMVYVVGDNRDNSEDSRRWGPVSIDAVLGRASSIWLSLDPCTGAVRTERFMLGGEGEVP